jgi:ubiquinone/menaquinone biosynthesis C-methylase UbiE
VDRTKSIAKDWETHTYYQQVETQAALNSFWADWSMFRPLFDTLDLYRTVELACGHGRHAAQIADRCGELVLLDINQTNIDFCSDRFAGQANVRTEITDGRSLGKIPDAWATAIYCYDAMVHFEATDVIGYLQDTVRALAPGGRALYHHSNLSRYPGREYHQNPHHRNFMSIPMFKHFAMRAGLRVVASQPVSWGHGADYVEDIDAVTLLYKMPAR